MKPISWAGTLLIVLGALTLAYQGINYTRQKQVVELGSAHLTGETPERMPLPPILGGLAVVGGVVPLVVGAKNKPQPGSASPPGAIAGPSPTSQRRKNRNGGNDHEIS